ncbi:1969_t:CDS:2 [Acaulospora colombiana]|uniref:1969_t:CDS:1 n=1 Tax=Acaulospora colombiana TaxID=27376 RepID=A0ACA9KJE5_9GLOM|nr:1969_t:CDS:2 [Acaulospora colombiana]
MALQPSLNPLLIHGSRDAANTLEFFWDYVCPFSKKSANCVENILKPLLVSKYSGKVKIIFRPHPQPWHASSTFVHEAGIAVAKAAPESFWKYSLALFNAQDDFFDEPTLNMTPTQIREKLVELGKSSGALSADQVAAVEELLKPKGGGNSGIGATDDLKVCIKYGRQNSIHVSPTVLFNGLVANDVSSSWGEAEWSVFLEKNIKG